MPDPTTPQTQAELREKIAREMCNAAWASVGEDWSGASGEQQDEFRLMADAALSVIAPLLKEAADAKREEEYWRAEFAEEKDLRLAAEQALAERDARLAEAEEVMRPFAEESQNWWLDVPDSHRSLCTEPGSKQAHPGSETVFTVGDLRRARAFLAQQTPTSSTPKETDQ